MCDVWSNEFFGMDIYCFDLILLVVIVDLENGLWEGFYWYEEVGFFINLCIWCVIVLN